MRRTLISDPKRMDIVHYKSNTLVGCILRIPYIFPTILSCLDLFSIIRLSKTCVTFYSMCRKYKRFTTLLMRNWISSPLVENSLISHYSEAFPTLVKYLYTQITCWDEKFIFASSINRINYYFCLSRNIYVNGFVGKNFRFLLLCMYNSLIDTHQHLTETCIRINGKNYHLKNKCLFEDCALDFSMGTNYLCQMCLNCRYMFNTSQFHPLCLLEDLVYENINLLKGYFANKQNRWFAEECSMFILSHLKYLSIYELLDKYFVSNSANVVLVHDCDRHNNRMNPLIPACYTDWLFENLYIDYHYFPEFKLRRKQSKLMKFFPYLLYHGKDLDESQYQFISALCSGNNTPDWRTIHKLTNGNSLWWKRHLHNESNDSCFYYA